MSSPAPLVVDFERHRAHLRTVAARLLGSAADADDAVQETWLRLVRADARGDLQAVANLRGWLTTVVARVCLDALRTPDARRARAAAPEGDAATVVDVASPDPLADAMRADAVGAALLLVLDTLTPPERVAFVLHDLFAVPFDEIAPIVARTPAATRQLASRARRRVQGAARSPAGPHDHVRRAQVVQAFLAASRAGDFAALLALLDPTVELRADEAAARSGAPAVVRGADAVATMFAGRAQAARAALIDGLPGAAWAPGGEPRVLFRFDIAAGRVRGIELFADPATLQSMSVVLESGERDDAASGGTGSGAAG